MATNPRKGIVSPEGPGPYSPRSLSRLAQGAHGRGRAPGAASPIAAGRAPLDAAHRHRRRCLRGPAPGASPPLGRPPAALGARRARPTRTRRHKLCVRARALNTCPHEPPDTLILSAVGSVWRSSVALLRNVPPVLGSALRPAPLAALARPLPLPPTPPTRGFRPQGSWRAGERLRVPWIPPNLCQESRSASDRMGFAQRFSGEPPPRCCPAFQFCLLRTPCPFAGRFCISERRAGGGVRN